MTASNATQSARLRPGIAPARLLRLRPDVAPSSINRWGAGLERRVRRDALTTLRSSRPVARRKTDDVSDPEPRHSEGLPSTRPLATMRCLLRQTSWPPQTMRSTTGANSLQLSLPTGMDHEARSDSNVDLDSRFVTLGWRAMFGTWRVSILGGDWRLSGCSLRRADRSENRTPKRARSDRRAEERQVRAWPRSLRPCRPHIGPAGLATSPGANGLSCGTCGIARS